MQLIKKDNLIKRLPNLYNYNNDTTSNTSITSKNSININLHIYLTQVVYGISKYFIAKITSKLVGAIIDTRPYTDWKVNVYVANNVSSYTALRSGANTPDTV